MSDNSPIHHNNIKNQIPYDLVNTINIECLFFFKKDDFDPPKQEKKEIIVHQSIFLFVNTVSGDRRAREFTNMEVR